jgi:hypothetical protein
MQALPQIRDRSPRVNVREHFGGKIDRDQARRVMTPLQRTHAAGGAWVSPATKQFLRMHVYAVRD